MGHAIEAIASNARSSSRLIDVTENLVDDLNRNFTGMFLLHASKVSAYIQGYVLRQLTDVTQGQHCLYCSGESLVTFIL